MKTNKYSGTKTEQNLRTAFSGESEARNKYTFFASTAKKEAMSRSPRSSRRPRTTKRSTPRCGSKSSRASAPPPTICSPPLRAKTTSGPTCTILSPRPQRKRAFPSWRQKFRLVGEIERHHEERYRALLRNVETAKVFEKSEVKVWECRNCGHIVVGTKAPDVCPTCNHPQSYFEVHAENY